MTESKELAYRNQQDSETRERPTITVRAGDGVSDDTAVIQEALDQALACKRQAVPKALPQP